MTEPSIISIATAGPCNFTNLFGNLYYTQNMAPTSFLFSVDRANEIPRLPISPTEIVTPAWISTSIPRSPLSFRLIGTFRIMPPSREAQIQEYGWGAVPCDPKQWVAMKKSTKPPVPQLVEDTPLPDTPIVKVAMEYAKAELPTQTFSHSMRVFYYGM